MVEGRKMLFMTCCSASSQLAWWIVIRYHVRIERRLYCSFSSIWMPELDKLWGVFDVFVIIWCFISLQYKLEVVWQWRMVPPGTLLSVHETWEDIGSVLLAPGVIFLCLAITGELFFSSLCYQSGRKCCSNGAVSSAVEGGRWDPRTEVELVAQVWVPFCCFKDSYLLQ